MRSGQRNGLACMAGHGRFGEAIVGFGDVIAASDEGVDKPRVELGAATFEDNVAGNMLTKTFLVDAFGS